MRTRWQAIRAMSTIQTQACAWQNLAIPILTYQCHATQATSRATEQLQVQAPRVVVEVLSDSTEGKDRIRKANLYHACPTIQEYVLIATKYQAVEVQRRSGDEWTLHLFGPGDEIELASLGIRFPLSILYRGTAVPEMLDGQDESDHEPCGA